MCSGRWLDLAEVSGVFRSKGNLTLIFSVRVLNSRTYQNQLERSISEIHVCNQQVCYGFQGHVFELTDLSESNNVFMRAFRIYPWHTKAQTHCPNKHPAKRLEATP